MKEGEKQNSSLHTELLIYMRKTKERNIRGFVDLKEILERFTPVPLDVSSYQILFKLKFSTQISDVTLSQT